MKWCERGDLPRIDIYISFSTRRGAKKFVRDFTNDVQDYFAFVDGDLFIQRGRFRKTVRISYPRNSWVIERTLQDIIANYIF